MERRAWTARGEPMTEADKAVIQGVVDKNKTAARIFVTGEVAEEYIGEAAVRLLININDVLYQNEASSEPLFVQTRADTVRMARFDPAFVWRCFHPETLVDLAGCEAGRLGVEMDPWGMDHFDFYQSMIAALRKKVGAFVPIAWEDSDIDAFYNVVYLSCLLLFDKPGYMAVPVAEHFARPKVAGFMRTIDYRPLEDTEQQKLSALRDSYSGLRDLTNPEMDFVVSLYERGRK